MRAPQVQADPGLPARVTIYEVGARDGLQNEKSVVPASVKAELIRRLGAAGLPVVETTSFVNPAWVPQLADAAEVLELLGPDGVGSNRPVLVPNIRGLDRALEAGCQAIAIFGSATETFAQRNLGRSIAESVAMFSPVVERARAEGLWVRAYVSMCFGDPWEGDVPVGQVVDAARRLMDLGCDELSLGDTIGVATTGQVPALLDGLDAAGIGRGAARRCDDRRLVSRWAGWLSLCQVGDRQPRDRGPRLGPAWCGCRDRGRPRSPRRNERVAGWTARASLRVAGRHRPRGVLTPWARSGRRGEISPYFRHGVST